MGVVGGKDDRAACLGFDFDVLAIEKRLTALKIIVQVTDDADVAGGNIIGNFLKAARQKQVIDMALVALPWLVAQDGAHLRLGKFDAVVLKE